MDHLGWLNRSAIFGDDKLEGFAIYKEKVYLSWGCCVDATVFKTAVCLGGLFCFCLGLHD